MVIYRDSLSFSFFFFLFLKRARGVGVGVEREKLRPGAAVRCFYMESKALRAGQGVPSQSLTVRPQTRLRLLELPYVCAGYSSFSLEETGNCSL